MAYAIVGYFDSISDKKIKEVWKGLADIAENIEVINLHIKIQEVFDEFINKESQNYFVPGIMEARLSVNCFI
jgi:hypothetical protein